MKDRVFMEEVNQCRSRMIDSASGSLASTMKKAALTLKKLLDAEGEAVRLSAAKAILDLGLKVAQATELERRVEALESLLSEKTPHDPTHRRGSKAL
jgi:HEAT repeat protein